jgi:hypothetical protein
VAAPETPQPAIPRKTLIYAGVIVALMWAFALYTGSFVLQIIVAVLTAIIAGLLLFAWRLVRKQKRLVGVLQGAQESPEARREALAKLEALKDADSPQNLFARAQLVAQDDPEKGLVLIEKVPLKEYPAAMQDDVATLQARLYLDCGRTKEARKAAETINLDNPQRTQARTMSGITVAEAFARTGKPKEALALLDTLAPIDNADQNEQIEVQKRIVKVFAKFAMNQRPAARNELIALAAVDINYLGRFLAPRFRVHPELQKLARQVGMDRQRVIGKTVG